MIWSYYGVGRRYSDEVRTWIEEDDGFEAGELGVVESERGQLGNEILQLARLRQK